MGSKIPSAAGASLGNRFFATRELPEVAIEGIQRYSLTVDTTLPNLRRESGHRGCEKIDAPSGGSCAHFQLQCQKMKDADRA